MLLDDRKKQILKAIIDDYVNTAEPIGSRTIARRYELGLSSATIRNEMADLEELGYLAQPHTSSGRIPSDRGYRFYVDELMGVDELSAAEIQNLRIELENKMREIQQLIKVAASALSRVTKYTTMASAPLVSQIAVKAVSIVFVDDRTILIVLIISGNLVKNMLVKPEQNVCISQIQILNNLLNEKLSGTPIHAVLSVLNAIDVLKYQISHSLFEHIRKGILECIKQIDSIDYVLEGTKNIFNFPEFNNLEKARVFLDMMEQQENIEKMLTLHILDDTIETKIGNENELVQARDFSIIIANYGVGDCVKGTIGIIGPTRMEYNKVTKYIHFVRKKINEEIRKLISE